jgi:uncharacterized protein (DUF302 family)
MSYYKTKIVDMPFDKAVEKVKEELSKEGFGVLTEIDVKATFKKKLDADFRNYQILGACNPHFAFKALNAERMIGTMLPCNVVVQDAEEPGKTEVTAIDPIASMAAINNPGIKDVALAVQQKLEKVIDAV